MAGIVDEAVAKRDGVDHLKISPYKNALVEFIKNTQTPITIGIQGDWGSGKTSLLNQIWNDLDPVNKDDIKDNNILQIWINSWEHSLLRSPEESLIKIIKKINIDKYMEPFNQRNNFIAYTDKFGILKCKNTVGRCIYLSMHQWISQTSPIHAFLR